MSRDALGWQPAARSTLGSTIAAVVVVAALALPLFAPTPAGAAKPQASCGATPSGWELIDFDEWWDRTVAAGLPLDLFTREDVEAGLESLDKNDDGLVCWKPLQATAVGAIPPYYFNGKDNTAARD